MCPIGFLMLGTILQDLPSDSPAAGGEPRCAPAPTNERSSRAPGLSWSATRSSWPRPTTSHHDGQVHTDASAGPAPPAPGSSARLPTHADDEPGMDAAGDHADPGHPSHTAACPPPPSRTSLRPDTAHAARHRHRTPDSGHLDAQTPAPDTGQRSRGQTSVDTDRSHRTPDTGHRTLAEDADRVTKPRPASRPPGPPRRATAHWNAQPCSCGRRLRRSTAHAGSAVRPPSSAR